VRWLAGGLKTQQGTAVLDALGLLDDGRITGRDSRYAGYFLAQLLQKGEGPVLNRSELLAGALGAEADVHFRLEPEWLPVACPDLILLMTCGDTSSKMCWPKREHLTRMSR
jgi:hypothetical protein